MAIKGEVPLRYEADRGRWYEVRRISGDLWEWADDTISPNNLETAKDWADRCFGGLVHVSRLDPAVQVAIDHKAALGNVTQWSGAWSIMGEVPPEAGKLVASTVFHGMLWLAFEGGLWCVMGGKLRKVTIGDA